MVSNDEYELKQRYLTQANFFTKSLFSLKREIQKDAIYLIQSKINFFGEVQDEISISFQDYIEFKGTVKKDTYSFQEFQNFVTELKDLGGAFYNRINHQYVSFNIVDSVSIDFTSPERLRIKLAQFGKIFFFEEELKSYIKKITPKGRPLKYHGHTQFENSIVRMKGFKRKRFYELLSQFVTTGLFKISFIELKVQLGYIEVINKETKRPLPYNEQLKMIFFQEDQFEIVDTCQRFSVFERDFLKNFIKANNEDPTKRIKNLKLKEKLKTGRSITHLVFTFDPIHKNLKEEEKKIVETLQEAGLSMNQSIYLLKGIGQKEVFSRWIMHIDRKMVEGEVQYIKKSDNTIITNLSGYMYTNLYPELQKM